MTVPRRGPGRWHPEDCVPVQVWKGPSACASRPPEGMGLNFRVILNPAAQTAWTPTCLQGRTADNQGKGTLVSCDLCGSWKGPATN